MLVLGVSLRNIRSYEELDLAFEEGITLLSGDIGAGKSTILQSIEFALFGTLRGSLDGESLLRHGSDEGTVTLRFSLRGAEYEIVRKLKRSSQGVRQSDGSLTEAGVPESLSSQELKARVLQLLGYPEQLLTKSKGLIFRHTVYTPQEEMKHIIFMPPEDRLNTLRMLFGIERYRTVKENAQLLLRDLRSTERQLSVEAGQVPALERELHVAADKAAASAAQVLARREEARLANAALAAARTEATKARLHWELAMGREQQRASLHARVKELERSQRNALEDIARIEEFLAVAVEKVEDVTPRIEESRRQLDALGEKLLLTSKELAGLSAKRQLIEQQERQIGSLDSCPVCQQPVTVGHKEHVHTSAASEYAAIDARRAALTAEETALRTARTALQRSIDTLSEQQKRYARHQRELAARHEQERQRARHRERLAEIAADLASASEQLRKIPPIDEALKAQYDEQHKLLEQAEGAQQVSLAAFAAAQEADSAAQAAQRLAAERVARAVESREALARTQSMKEFIELRFLELVSTIEQHVLASIHAEFRELFTSWFSRLLGDDTIQVTLGEQFEPLVSQNGYDSSLEQLSGGEKTAVALSYRLSLYRVVSDFITTIATKDVLILDEPTDGFSSEQLDRVRDVLRELQCRQIILVSHESQMESGCDRVIRVSKSMHRSSADDRQKSL